MNTEAGVAAMNLPAPVITPVLALVNAALDEGDGLLERARAMAEPLLVGETFDGGENHWQHAQDGSARKSSFTPRFFGIYFE